MADNCGKDAKDSGDDIITPCLKEKGHSGNCQHLNLCKINYCICHIQTSKFDIPSVKPKLCGNSGAVGVPMDIYRKIEGKNVKVTIEVLEP